jgi:hypothetical protein
MHHSLRQFVEYRGVDERAIGRIGNHRRESARRKSILKEIHLHGEPGAEQRHRVQPLINDRVSRRIEDIDHR